MKKIDKEKIYSLANKLRSAWTFPILLTLALVALSILSVHGSSIGYYQKVFYGNETDNSLIANEPQSIRSDEYVVNAQKYIAQSNNNFAPVNQNVGNGENESVVSDNPTTDWTGIFKPQNFGFFILPFDNAFALKWWFLPYLLIIATYLTVLIFLPKRFLLASIISIGFACSPFLNWWYTNGTFSTISFALLGFAVLAKLVHSKSLKYSVLLTLLLVYIAGCFALILYPPFQIPVALVVFAVSTGYIINVLLTKERIPLLKQKLLVLGGGLILLVAIMSGFFYTHKDAIHAIQSSEYPGARVVHSGGYSKEHILSSHHSPIFQNEDRASYYQRPDIKAVNQSESSNFILLIPFLAIPFVALAYLAYKRSRKIDYLALGLIAVGSLFAIWLFIPGLDVLGIITFLNKVPHPRLLIGVGVLNLFFIIYFIYLYANNKSRVSILGAGAYSLLVYISLLLISFHVMTLFPGFIGYKSAVILGLPLAIVTYLLLRKHFTLAATLFALFSLFSIYQINPIYKGTEILTRNPLAEAMHDVAGSSDKKWVTEDIIILNFPAMYGYPSLAGTYLHPQNELWSGLGQTDKSTVYNRYAHVNFTFDRDASLEITPLLTNPGEDQMNIRIEPCDTFFSNNNVGYLITSRKFEPGEASCLSYVKSVDYPKVTLNIYQLR